MVVVTHKEKGNLAIAVCLCPHTHECPLGMHLPCTLSWMLGTGGGPGSDKAHSMERLASQLRVQRSGEGFLSSEKAKNKDPRQEHAQALSLALSAFRVENSSLWTVLGL